jgi:hypothetical protein
MPLRSEWPAPEHRRPADPVLEIAIVRDRHDNMAEDAIVVRHDRRHLDIETEHQGGHRMPGLVVSDLHPMLAHHDRPSLSRAASNMLKNSSARSFWSRARRRARSASKATS